MERLLKLVPFVAFLSFLTKITIYSPSIADALILGSLVAYIILDQLRLKDKKLMEYDGKIADLLAVQAQQAADLKTLTSALNSVKLSNGLRSVNHGKV